jgi:hypothetical protein
LDCRHVCKTCAFHDALQAGKQKEVDRTPLIWRLLASTLGQQGKHSSGIGLICATFHNWF